jgi:flagellar biosynthesis anti-sigma factor FlgM
MKEKNKSSAGIDRRPPEPSAAAEPRPATGGTEGAAASAAEARLMAKARQIIEQTPEVRPEKVAALREAMRRGSYRIKTRQLANILIVKMFTER